MVFTNVGAEEIAVLLGSDTGTYIKAYGIGIGSATDSITSTVLESESQRRAITGNPTFSSQITTFQGDFNSVQMSGTDLTEFGLFPDVDADAGSLWFKQTIGSIGFDGTNELQISTAIRVIAESGT